MQQKSETDKQYKQTELNRVGKKTTIATAERKKASRRQNIFVLNFDDKMLFESSDGSESLFFVRVQCNVCACERKSCAHIPINNWRKRDSNGMMMMMMTIFIIIISMRIDVLIAIFMRLIFWCVCVCALWCDVYLSNLQYFIAIPLNRTDWWV